MFLADAATYGADKEWCLLKPIPIELDGEDDGEEAGPSGASGGWRTNETLEEFLRRKGEDSQSELGSQPQPE